MPKFEMPKMDTSEPSEYAGREPEYANKSVMLTNEGQKVVILNYQKDAGLYVVMNIDEAGTRSPAYRISPEQLIKIEDENNAEHIPTQEEVLSIFKQLIGETEFGERRKLEDEQGLYLWEITIPTEDGHTEYQYMRKGLHKEGVDSVTSIYITFFDNEGIPISGHDVASFVDGEWKVNP